MPNSGEIIEPMIRHTFCGQFSDDGTRFINACQGMGQNNNLNNLYI